jgi:DNA-binding MarR family transcriptional regulator
MTTDPYLTRSLGFLLADVSRLVRQRFDARARALGLTRAQWRVLAQLRRREGINQASLAEILEIEPITLGRHIDRLVEKGFVERRADPSDRRAWRLYLRAEVQPVLDRLRKMSQLTGNEALQGIPEAESDRLIELLLKIKGNMLALDVAESDTPDANGQG